jgi:hypothetical protein
MAAVVLERVGIIRRGPPFKSVVTFEETVKPVLIHSRMSSSLNLTTGPSAVISI